jgi:hypothetical protein
LNAADNLTKERMQTQQDDVNFRGEQEKAAMAALQSANKSLGGSNEQ